MLVNRKPMEVAKSIKRLDYITEQFKHVFKTLEEAKKKGYYDPFIGIEYSDVVKLKKP